MPAGLAKLLEIYNGIWGLYHWSIWVRIKMSRHPDLFQSNPSGTNHVKSSPNDATSAKRNWCEIYTTLPVLTTSCLCYCTCRPIILCPAFNWSSVNCLTFFSTGFGPIVGPLNEFLWHWKATNLNTYYSGTLCRWQKNNKLQISWFPILVTVIVIVSSNLTRLLKFVCYYMIPNSVSFRFMNIYSFNKVAVENHMLYWEGCYHSYMLKEKWILIHTICFYLFNSLL